MSMSLIPALFALFSAISLVVIVGAMLKASKSWKQLQNDWAALEASVATPAATVISIQTAHPDPAKLQTRSTAPFFGEAPMQAAA